MVLLPKERMLCTGDLLTGALPDMADGNITDWVSTLEAMKVLDFDTVLPARGAPFKGKDKIVAWQSYLRDVLAFPEIAGPGVDLAAVKRLQTQIELDPPFQP